MEAHLPGKAAGVMAVQAVEHFPASAPVLKVSLLGPDAPFYLFLLAFFHLNHTIFVLIFCLKF